MKNRGKTLTDRLYSLKKALYVPLAAAGLALLPYAPLPAQQKITETELFTDNTVGQTYLEEHPEKWDILNQQLEAKDFDRSLGDTDKLSGYTRMTLTGTLYNFTKNQSIELIVGKQNWPNSSSELIGFTFAGDPLQKENGTYYQFMINAPPNSTPQLSISRQSPGHNHSYFNNVSNFIVPGGTNKLNMIYNNTGIDYTDTDGKFLTKRWNIFINDNKIDTTFQRLINPDLCPIIPETCQIDPDTGEIIPDSCQKDYNNCPPEAFETLNYLDEIPLLEGDMGFVIFDSVRESFSSLSIFDNVVIKYDGQGGGGGAFRKREQPILGRVDRKLGGGGGRNPRPHSRDDFIRGDSNMNGVVEYSDVIHITNYLFGIDRPRLADVNYTRGRLKCPDAADVNDDGNVNISDSILLMQHLADPINVKILPPNIGGQGIDLTVDNLEKCKGYKE